MGNKTEAPKTITRLNLILTLNKQYGGSNPFILKKDGKSLYDFKNDKISFTCCNIGDHIHSMTPLQILQLYYIYGNQPCPYCYKNGHRKRNVKLSEAGTEDGSIMSENKKYLVSNDPSENAKRIADVESELAQERKLIQEYEKKRQAEENSDDIVESVSYDDYIKNENPEFVKDSIVSVDSENNIIENTPVYNNEIDDSDDDLILPEENYEDDDIVESETYEEYTLKNPDYNEKIIGNEKLNKKPKNIFDLDMIFNNGQEEGSVYSMNNEDEKETKKPVNKKPITRLEKLLGKSATNNDNNQNLNNKNTNILLSEIKQISNSSEDDEEEPFDI